MTKIHAHDIATFATGWRVAAVLHGGARQVTRKGATGSVEVVDQPFAAGDVVLVGVDGHVIVGPLSFDGALELARRVLECDPRTVSDTMSIRALASAVIGFAAQIAVPPEPSPEAPIVALGPEPVAEPAL